MNTDTPKFSRNQLTDALTQDKVLVTFIKVDGTRRDMTCTLKPDLIPQDNSPKAKLKTVKYSDDIIRVFALDDTNGWRSFRVDSVIAMATVLE